MGAEPCEPLPCTCWNYGLASFYIGFVKVVLATVSPESMSMSHPEDRFHVTSPCYSLPTSSSMYSVNVPGVDTDAAFIAEQALIQCFDQL